MSNVVSTCGCGRSPTGKCIGWHALSEEEYKKKLASYRGCLHGNWWVFGR